MNFATSSCIEFFVVCVYVCGYVFRMESCLICNYQVIILKDCHLCLLIDSDLLMCV